MLEVKMDNSHVEYIADIIGSHESSYMSQICNKIFIYNTTDPVSFIDATCRNWFLEALQHCSEMLFLHPEPKVHTWLFHQVMNLRYFIFPRSGDTSLMNKNPHIRIHPDMLTRSDCNHLFIEAAKDYIDIAPKYAMCLEDNFYFGTFLKALLGVFSIYVLFVFVRSIADRRLWSSRRKKLSQPVSSPIENEAIVNKFHWHNNRTLARQRFEIDHFKIENNNVQKMMYDPPMFAIRVKKGRLSEALCCLIKSDPSVDEQRNGFIRDRVVKSRRYALHKLNLFLNNRSHCRVVLDLGYDEDDSDLDVESQSLPLGVSYSGGDQFFHGGPRPNESTLDESADTSSVNSVRLCAERSTRVRRNTNSKYRLNYLQSLQAEKSSSIPMAEKHRTCLARRESSNSVAIVQRRDSRISMRRGNELTPSALSGRGTTGAGGAVRGGVGAKVTKV